MRFGVLKTILLPSKNESQSISYILVLANLNIESYAKIYCYFLEYGEEGSLTKNQVGLLLVKLCFERLQEETLTLEQLNGQLQIHLKEIRNEKVKHFKDISSLPLNEFLTLNKDSFIFKSKKGRRYVKLKSIRKIKNPKLDHFLTTQSQSQRLMKLC